MDEFGTHGRDGARLVIMAPEGDRPLILQKAGGLQGVFSYVAFAPARNIGVFAAINAFDFNAGLRWLRPPTTSLPSLRRDSLAAWLGTSVAADGHFSGTPALRSPSRMRSRCLR